LIFFWLNDVQLAIERVNIRVSEGGHSIPEEVIRRRYAKGIFNLMNTFIKICDYWLILNNSIKPYQNIADGTKENVTNVYDETIWDKINNKS
jgi:predicted ABC-type ATPase